MTCQCVQDCMERYLADTLSDSELKEFVSHVQQCAVCREELEIYYIIDMAKNIFDDDTDTSYDITQIVEDSMKERMIKRQERYHRKLFLSFLYVFAMAAAILGMYVLFCMI